MRVRSHAQEVARTIVELRPAPGSRFVAFRAALSLLVPLVVLWGADRLAWAPYAAFGAFTALYGRQSRHAARAGMQLQAGATLLVCAVLGAAVATAESPQLVVLGGAVVSVVSAWLSDRYAWHPPGPLFPVFAFAACATIPGTTGGDVAVGAVVALCSVAFALLVGSAGRFRRERFRPVVIRRGARSLSWRSERRHLARYLIAPLVAGEIADLAHWGHVYWAMVGAVVPMAAPALHGRLARGLQRILGTLVGVGVAYLALSIPMPVIWLIVVGVVLQGLAELLIGRNYGLTMLVVTPLALIIGQVARAAPVDTLIRDRAVETALGTGVGLVLTLVLWDVENSDNALPALASH